MSRTIVLKFGGTSVAEPERIVRAAQRAIAGRRGGARVAVVVSAPGEMTDELIALGRRVAASPDPRELDVLMATGEQVSMALFALACRARGAHAISLTGAQAGFITDGRHGGARILRVNARRVRAELAKGRVVAVAGFQGADSRGDITTLGRGGSDLSAVALAGALRAASCEIFTDVKGVYTADPRLVPEARKLASISYEEMLSLAAAGAQVMQARSIEAARRLGVRLQVRSAFSPSPGTWIVPAGEAGDAGASSLALARDGRAATITAVGRGFRRDPEAARRVLEALSSLGARPRRLESDDLSVRCAVDAPGAEAALRGLHKALGLGGRAR